jgi:hypothetical protein
VIGSKAAQHWSKVMLHFWHNLHVTSLQLDELWRFIHTKKRNLPSAKNDYHESYGDAWVWLAFAPVWKVIGFRYWKAYPRKHQFVT